MPMKYMECAQKCRSKKHAYALHSAITKGCLREIQSYFALCYNPGKLSDTFGRSAIHIAASCGKLDVLEWLLEETKVDLNHRDVESGWTALHRAVFYGQLGAARMLLQYRGDLSTRDHEGLGPLDIVMKDRQLVKSVPKPVYSMTDKHDVYTWGDNASFTLGQVTDHRLQIPEVVDEFRKNSIDLRKIVMCKYHTVFITGDGLVYTCGQGHGGRLGHQTEEICVVPKLVKAMKNDVCIDVAASRDHTLLLTKNGVLYSCGLNDFHQLGQFPIPEKCLTPRQVNCKMLKGKQIKGICTGRFHTVVYTADAVYTCGLNAGQLGHPRPVKDERQLSLLRQVTALTHRNISIISVVCSDAATVIFTKSGEMFVLHEYQCRKITSNRTDVKLVYAIGGKLDYTDTQNLRENGGRELIISYMNHCGKIFIWRESSPSFKRVHWLIKRQLYVVDYTLTLTTIAIVTDSGEVFIGNLSNKAPPVKEPIRSNKESTEGEFGRVTLLELTMQEGIEDVHVRKIPNIHRAMYISADRKGHNYATFQSQPNSCLTDGPVISDPDMQEDFSQLLDEADEYDLIHDVILEVHGQRWPAHKYILVSRCANFHSIYPKCVLSAGDVDNIPIIKINNVHPQIFEQLITYIYTDMCDLLSIGAKFVMSDNQTIVKDDIFHMEIDTTEDAIDNHCVSAFQVREQNKKKKGKDGKRKSSQSKSNQEGKNPLKLLSEIGNRWGVPGLVKRLECLTYQNGYVRSAGETIPRSLLHFDRNKMKDTKLEMYDVSLKSDDGVVFQCHRCILVARLEYFHSMLATGWMETSTSKPLSLPVPSDILEILLDFLYTDECPFVTKAQNMELLCNILVVADQLLVTRLKEMCEAAIAELITLKNVGELLEFSSTYNAGQLRATCQQYIVINLSSLLENRYLDMISDEVMEELTAYYRQSIDNMSRRMITPYDEPPDSKYLASLVDMYDTQSLPSTFDTKKAKPKKKRARTKSGTEDRKTTQRGEKDGRRLSERQMSISSDISVKSDEDLVSPDSAPEEKFKQLEISVTDPEENEDRMRGANKTETWSPTSPKEPAKSPSVSLRDIMEQEQTDTQKTHSSSTNKPGRFSWKDVKKQQKAQLKAAIIDKQEKNCTTEPELKATGFCPWGSVNQTVQSFRSLMLEEQSGKPTPVSKQTDQGSKKGQNPPVKQTNSDTKLKKDKGSGRNILSWGLPSSGKVTPAVQTEKVKKKAWEDPGQMARSPDNPWNMAMAQSPPDRGHSLSDIIQDEKHKHAVLTKALNKPLGLIQIEEQAIQDLLGFYNASSNVDEHITVERVCHVAASPIWKRERLTSS